MILTAENVRNKNAVWWLSEIGKPSKADVGQRYVYKADKRNESDRVTSMDGMLSLSPTQTKIMRSVLGDNFAHSLCLRTVALTCVWGDLSQLKEQL